VALTATFERAAEERSRTLADRIVPRVERFLAPSRFLRDRFVREWGIPEARIEHLPFGVDLARFSDRQRTSPAPTAKLRVTFLGSLVPLKGPHLLLEAWGLVPPAVRARGSLALHGPAQHHPEYQEMLGARAKAVGATLGPSLDREGVAAVLAATDLLVVPSLWYENSPLVILEALASSTPLLVSDLGGMAELVEPGVSGFHFRMGDARDLAEKLTAALERRAGLERLYAKPVAPPGFGEHVEAVEARYRNAIASRG
jgi:glycosyltransferase involved in cell wall biosynthesis